MPDCEGIRGKAKSEGLLRNERGFEGCSVTEVAVVVRSYKSLVQSP